MRYESAALVDQLRALGLTGSETKAYLAVLKLGPCRVVQIAHESQLQRTEIYDLMSRLVSMGLIQETIDRPKRYQASSVQEGITRLAERAINQVKSIAAGSKRLTAKLEALRTTAEMPEEPGIRIITGLRNIRRNFHEMLTSAQTEVWMAAGRHHVALRSRSDLRTALNTIATKHLRARILCEVDESNVTRLMRLTPLVQIQHHQPIHAHLYGVDDRSVAVGFASPTETDPDNVSEILVTHTGYVRMMQDFFSALWNQATPLAARMAMLEGRHALREQTRVIWGREEIHSEVANWPLKARDRIADITSPCGPARALVRFKDPCMEARKRGVKLQMICNVSRENIAAVKEASKIVEIRHSNSPLGVGIAVLDKSEAVIHYIHPDSPDLSSPTDVSIHTTNQIVARDLGHMFDLIWQYSVPLEKRLRQLSRKKENLRARKRAVGSLPISIE